MYNTLSKLVEKIRGEGNSFSVCSTVPASEARKAKITVEIAGQDPHVFESVDDFVLMVGQAEGRQGVVFGSLIFLLGAVRDLQKNVSEAVRQNVFTSCGGKCRE